MVYNAQGTRDGNMTTFTRDIVSHTVPAMDSNSTDITWVDFPGKTYVYSDNTTDFPFPLPRIENFDMNHIGWGLRGTFLGLVAVVMGLSLFFAGWTFHHRNERVVNSSQPLFLYLICTGTFLMSWAIVSLSIDDDIASEWGCSVACMATPWFFAIGFAFSFSALFAKEWRMNKIFHNPSLTRVKVEPKDVIVPLIVLLGVNVLVLALWTGLSPLSWERSYVGSVDKYGRNLESVGACTAEAVDWAPYAGVLLVINFSMVGLASLQAYRARKIAVEYSESKWVAIILCALVQATVVGLPLMVIARGDPTLDFFVKAGIVFIICITALLAIFVPKFFYMKDARIAAAKKRQRLSEQAARRAEYQRILAETQELPADESGNTSDSGENTLHTLRDSNKMSSLGMKVLFHPANRDHELEELKSELEEAKNQLRRTVDSNRRTIDPMNRRATVDSIDHAAESDTNSVPIPERSASVSRISGLSAASVDTRRDEKPGSKAGEVDSEGPTVVDEKESGNAACEE